MKLQGKVVIITGGGRGIGRAVAEAFAREGASLVVASRTAAELEQTLQLLEPCQQAIAIPSDVSKADEAQGLIAQTIDRFGRIDILVNAAAIQGPIGPLWTVDLKRWREALDVNLLGTMHCCHFAVPHMIAAGGGRIINFAGGGAAAPRPNFSAYAASKAAVVRLTETLAEELKSFGVAVNAIAPGLVNTRMLDAIIEAGAVAGAEASIVQALRNDDVGGVPVALPAELALFLASAAPERLTGRLISAPHDDWREWSGGARLEEISARPWFTLRRLDPHTLRQLLGDR